MVRLCGESGILSQRHDVSYTSRRGYPTGRHNME